MHHPNAPKSGSLTALLAGLLTAGIIAALAACATGVQGGNEVEWLTQLAGNGDVGARLQLGLAYRDGRYGLKADPQTALHWLTAAGRGGNAYAADAVGNLYAGGQGIPQDVKQAVYWWRIAAQGGNGDAQKRLGEELLREGEEDRALVWLRGAADRGDPNAHADLERLYRDNVATEADLHRGEDSAAALSDRLHFPGLEATFGLWDSIEAGSLEAQSSDELLARARSGDPVAEYQLAIRYRDGAWAVPRDPQQSLLWLQRSAQAGNPVAIETLARTPSSE